MKHCSQCGFTFDDQQQICDFDGTELSVVPERPPSIKSVSFAPATAGSFVRRLVQSRAGLPALALTGVVGSALLIGYYDSVTQANIDTSVSQTQNDTASMVPSNQINEVGQMETQADRPRIMSTQRLIGSDELPSSMVKRLQGSRSRSAKSRRALSRSKLVATKRKPDNAKRQSQARNQPRLGSRERVRQQQSAARMANGQPSWRTGSANSRQWHARNQATPASRERGDQQYSVARVPNGRPRLGASESAHHERDSKVIAMLKKTGSILKRPFELIAGR